MELLKLLGVLFVVIGFAMKWDTIATVVAAGLITGLVAMLNGTLTFMEIFEILGSSFISQRLTTLLVLSIGVIGICERYGLKDKAVDLIRKISKATTGGVLSVWLIIRTVASALSLRLGGHVQFILPLIHPMAEGAAAARYGELDETVRDTVKGAACAVENYGNFFAQNCFMGSSGTLLIVSTLAAQGYEVSALRVALACLPVAAVNVVIGIVQNALLDRRLNRQLNRKAH